MRKQADTNIFFQSADGNILVQLYRCSNVTDYRTVPETKLNHKFLNNQQIMIPKMTRYTAHTHTTTLALI